MEHGDSAEVERIARRLVLYEDRAEARRIINHAGKMMCAARDAGNADEEAEWRKVYNLGWKRLREIDV